MSARELAVWLGRTGTVAVDGRGSMRCAVKVIDVRAEFGCIRLLVKPVAGDGETWIDSSRFRGGSPSSPDGKGVIVG